MLQQRILTAVALLPLVIGVIGWAPLPWLYAFLTLGAALAAREWARFCGVGQERWRVMYALLSVAVLAALWWMQGLWLALMAIACGWWVLCAALLPGFPDNLQRWAPANGWFLALGPLQWIPTVLASVGLRRHPPPAGALELLYVFVLVWAADTGAYLVGRLWGRRKLAPAISPGKTVEGALGGIGLCAVWAAVGGAYVLEIRGSMLGVLVGWSVLAAVLSIVGDLTESMFKRRAGLKDSGMLLPGHGGMLDRIDSLMAVAPFMALGLRYLAKR